jgi:hypothetical protein
MLAFARRQDLQPQATNVTALVAGMDDLLQSWLRPENAARDGGGGPDGIAGQAACGLVGQIEGERVLDRSTQARNNENVIG